MIPFKPYNIQFIHTELNQRIFYFADLDQDKVLDLFNESEKEHIRKQLKNINHYHLLVFKEYAEVAKFWDVKFSNKAHFLIMATTPEELQLMLNNLYENGYLNDSDEVVKLTLPFDEIDKIKVINEHGKDKIIYEYRRTTGECGSRWLGRGYYGQRMELYTPYGHRMIKPNRRVRKHYRIRDLKPLYKHLVKESIYE